MRCLTGAGGTSSPTIKSLEASEALFSSLFGELLHGTLAAKSVTFNPVGMSISGLFPMSMSISSS